MKKNANRVVNLLLLMTGTIAQLYLLSDTVGCRLSRRFPLWMVLLCLVIWFSAHIRHGALIGIPVFGVLAALAVRNAGPELLLEFQDFFDRLTGTFYENILYRGRTYPFLNLVQDHTLLFLIIGVLVAGYLAMALSSRGARTSLVLIGALPMTAACILINETPPAAALLAIVLFLFLTAVGGSFYRDNSGSFAAVLGTLAPLALLLSLLLLAVDPQNYVYEPPKVDLREEMKNFLQAADEWADDLLNDHDISVPEFLTAPRDNASSGQNPSAGALPPSDPSLISPEELPEGITPDLIWQSVDGALDLTQNASPEDLELVVLRVKSDTGGRIYLRGSSFGDYTGTGWKRVEQEVEVSSLPFTARALAAAGAGEQKLSVRVQSSSGIRFLPYFSEEQQGLDSYVPSNGEDRYEVLFRSAPSLTGISAPAEADELEAQYRTYAHSFYTRLPEETRTAMLNLCASEGLDPASGNLIAEVASFVRSSGVYDLNTPAYPGNDYALYFLTTAHQGYCIHFATAATVLYRALGIPARMTAGFVAETDAGRYTDVKAADAHAWVEVYQDGIGWIPVEVTGRSGLNEGIPGPQDETQPEYASPEEELPEGALQEEPLTEQPAETGSAQNSGDLSPTEGQTAADGAQTLQPTPVPTPQPSASLPVGPVTQPVQTPQSEAARHSRTLQRIVLAVLCALLPPAAILLRRAAVLSLRRRRLQQADANKAVVTVFRTAEQASRYGDEVPREIRTAAEKAAFSRNGVSETEAEVSRAHLHLLLQRVYQKQNLWNKFRYKYLSALI